MVQFAFVRQVAAQGLFLVTFHHQKTKGLWFPPGTTRLVDEDVSAFSVSDKNISAVENTLTDDPKLVSDSLLAIDN